MGEQPKARARLLSQQRATGRAAPPIRGRSSASAAAGVGGDPWAELGGCYYVAKRLVGQRLEVWWETAAAPSGAWQAGYARAISRTRGLQIEYDDGEIVSHRDISLANEGEVWLVPYS